MTRWRQSSSPLSLMTRTNAVRRRKGLIYNQAVEMINKCDISDKKVIVLAKRGWHTE